MAGSINEHINKEIYLIVGEDGNALLTVDSQLAARVFVPPQK